MANDINKQIEDRIRAFADELNDLVRQAALDAVSQALGVAGARRPTRAAAPAPRATKARGRAGAGRRGRRSPQQMAGTMTEIRDFVTANPGARMEHMTRSLGQPAARLRSLVNKLLGQGAIRKTGEKRATQYYPSSGRGGAVARKRTTAAKARRKGGRKKAGRKKSARKRKG